MDNLDDKAMESKDRSNITPEAKTALDMNKPFSKKDVSLINHRYQLLNQKKKELIVQIKKSNASYVCGFYNGHSIRTENGWLTEEYPIPVITIKQYGDIGIDFELIFYEVIISRDQALHIDYKDLESYHFEVYGTENYLNDFYNKTMNLSQIQERIRQSNEKEVALCFYYRMEDTAELIWKSILEIQRRVSKENISFQQYIKSPCSVSSLPYWKTQNMKLPDTMKVVRQDEMTDDLLNHYDDSCYFKLVYRYQDHIENQDHSENQSQELNQDHAENQSHESNLDPEQNQVVSLPQYSYQQVDPEKEQEDIIAMIQNCYEDITINQKQIETMISEAVYDPSLWIWICDRQGHRVGLGIADFDKTIHEGILEWIQILPDFRGQGAGSNLVSELLHRMKNKADFVTVSGQVNNQWNPEKLYLSCGFTEDVIWHVLTPKKDNKLQSHKNAQMFQQSHVRMKEDTKEDERKESNM